MPPQRSSICPPTPPASIKPSPTLTPLADEAVTCCTCMCAKPPQTPRLSFSVALDLFLKLLGIVCAILFGVWAPLSYYLQKSGNQSNDGLTNEVKKLSKELAEQRKDMSELAMLRGLEYCEGKEGAEMLACSAFSSSFQLSALINGLTATPDASKRTLSLPSRFDSEEAFFTTMNNIRHAVTGGSCSYPTAGLDGYSLIDNDCAGPQNVTAAVEFVCAFIVFVTISKVFKYPKKLLALATSLYFAIIYGLEGMYNRT